MNPPFYFGCYRESGHYLWDAQLRRERWGDIEKAQPWGLDIDSRLCDRNDNRAGAARLHHKDGWTALAFWDYSVDTRPGSNSVFLFHELLGFDSAVALAKEAFPAIWARFKFEVRPAKEAP